MNARHFKVTRGTEFRIQLTVTIDGSSDLTGYTAEGHVREFPESAEKVAVFAFEPSALNATGQFDALLSKEVTAGIEAGEYFYDIKINKTHPIFVLKGKIVFVTPTTHE
jgi:hypothetical protein